MAQHLDHHRRATAEERAFLETLLFLLPALLLASRKGRPNPGGLVREALIIAGAAALYRFDVFLVAFNPGVGWHYFPSVQEMLITVGLVSLEIAAYIFLVKRFPIFVGGEAPFTPRTV